MIARDSEGRYPNGGYERFTDAARAWIIGHPYYSHFDHNDELKILVVAALRVALDEGVNYIDVSHLETAESLPNPPPLV